MKTLMNFLGVMIFALSLAFIGCSKEPDPQPINPPTDTTGHVGNTKDSIIVEVTLDVPECLILTETQVKLLDSVFSEGFVYQFSTENKRVYKFVSTESKLVGTNCYCIAILAGWCNDMPASIVFVPDKPEETGNNIVIKKGVNRVTLKYYVK